MKPEDMIYLEKPELHRPCMIIGFEGWPNAAEISSYVLQHLIDQFDAKKFASIPTETFYQTSSFRPIAVIQDGKLVELKTPGNHFYYVRNSLSRDLILFFGIEPHLRWDVFTRLLLNLAEEFHVEQLFTIGGTYDYIPHSALPIVSALFNQEDLREKVIQAGFELTNYTGSISIQTFILEEAKNRDMKGIGIWGHAPQYLHTKNIKVACSVLEKLAGLAQIDIDRSELELASRTFDQQVNLLVEQDPKLREIIGKFEEVYHQSRAASQPLQKGVEPKTGKVITFQAFLKKTEDEEKK